MRSVLSILPTTNYNLVSDRERADQMESFARVLMGLSHPIQVITRSRAVTDTYNWPKPPTLKRDWLVVLEDADAAAENSLTGLLKGALEGIGLRCTSITTPDVFPSFSPRDVTRSHALDWPDLASTLVLRRWPREVAPGWLGLALAGTIPVDTSIHIAPQDADAVARHLKTQHERQAGSDDAADQLGAEDAETQRKAMVARTDQPVRVAVAMTVRAPTPAQLKQRVAAVQHSCRLALADVREATFEHDRGLMATLPTGTCDLLSAWHGLDCTSAASTWPFQPVTVDHANGVPVGVTHKGGMLVRLDPFDPSLEGFSGVVIGKKRMGKSYFMKILARGLAERGVEVTIVEQRNPPEYAVLQHPNITLVNIEQIASDEENADAQMNERVMFLRRFTSELWDRARRDPKPRMLIVDEAWMLLRQAQSAAWVETVARTGGHFGLALWLLSQQVREFLSTGRAVLDNAEVRIFLKQHDTDLDDICEAAGLGKADKPATPAKRFLRSAARGQMLLGVGDMWVDVDVARVPEHYQISTDPRDIWNRETADDSGDTADEDRSTGDESGVAGLDGGLRAGLGASARGRTSVDLLLER